MKDPAFLFYSDNFLSGTMFLTDEQIGKYIRLLCAQHQTGHLHEKDMIFICKTKDDDIWSKFVKDEKGLWYNERLEIEINKRKAYSESRSNNKKGKIKKTKKSRKSYDSHMGNGIEDEFVLNEYKELYEKWMNYKKERKESYISKESRKLFYNQLLKYSNNNPEIAKLIIEKSMANNWAGIFELKQPSVKSEILAR
jgi:uncharacterized protein YdaU (DUF1376 family)